MVEQKGRKREAGENLLAGGNDLAIHPAQEFFFAGEIEVEGRPGDPRVGGGLSQGGGLMALPPEFIGRTVGDLLLDDGGDSLRHPASIIGHR